MAKLRVAFFGTPEFAVPSLHSLAEFCEVIGVFCQPDRVRSRTRVPEACAVKRAALQLGLPVLQPEKASLPETVDALAQMRLDWLVVAAYGQILSQALLDTPRWGCLNVHASLLPHLRGASPIHHALMAGEGQTGISLMRMVRRLDAGPVYVRQSTAIQPEENRFALEERLAKMAAILLTEHLPQLHLTAPMEQDEGAATYAPMIQRAHGLVRWQEEAGRLANLVRALCGWPGVWCRFRDLDLRLDATAVSSLTTDLPPGHFVLPPQRELLVACGAGSVLNVRALQPAGRRTMTAQDFINGLRPQASEFFLPGAA
jgi:methionyl-tRNA formyltransferase